MLISIASAAECLVTEHAGNRSVSIALTQMPSVVLYAREPSTIASVLEALRTAVNSLLF